MQSGQGFCVHNLGRTEWEMGAVCVPKIWARKPGQIAADYIKTYIAPKSGQIFTPRFWAQNACQLSCGAA